jgi:hypothetical protein
MGVYYSKVFMISFYKYLSRMIFYLKGLAVYLFIFQADHADQCVRQLVLVTKYQLTIITGTINYLFP